MTVHSLSVIDFKHMLDRDINLTLLDVREDHEQAYCRIMTSPLVQNLHIPMREIASRSGEIAIQGPIVVYCHHGVRSMVVAQWLAKRGFESLFNLDGGIDAWSAMVDPNVLRY